MIVVGGAIVIQVTQVRSPTLAVPNGGVDQADDDDEEDEEVADVPYTYEVEEIQEQEQVRDEVVERTVPQIKANYPYKGNGMEMAKGEVLFPGLGII